MKSSWRNLTPRRGRNGSFRATICFISGLLAVVLLFVSPGKASAAPPANADLQNHAWFESLEQPGERHLLCCSIADCHLTASRPSQDGYEVAIENTWIIVLADRVLQNVSNPTGRAVVCYRHIINPELKQWELKIFCFVRPPEV
jgi:hypothetical protein